MRIFPQKIVLAVSALPLVRHLDAQWSPTPVAPEAGAPVSI